MRRKSRRRRWKRRRRRQRRTQSVKRLDNFSERTIIS